MVVVVVVVVALVVIVLEVVVVVIIVVVVVVVVIGAVVVIVIVVLIVVVVYLPFFFFTIICLNVQQAMYFVVSTIKPFFFMLSRIQLLLGFQPHRTICHNSLSSTSSTHPWEYLVYCKVKFVLFNDATGTH